MPPYQQRVIDEKAALSLKIEALNRFKHAPDFENLTLMNQRLLLAQYAAMVAYENILQLRIDIFTDH